MIIYDKLKYILLNKLNINFIFLNLILMKFVKNIKLFTLIFIHKKFYSLKKFQLIDLE